RVRARQRDPDDVAGRGPPHSITRAPWYARARRLAMKKPTSAALVLILILSIQGYATDWIVGPFGSGAPFYDIQTAVNAAQPGDRVLVLPGAYVQGTIIIDKAIEVIGAGSSVV